jgi:two-component system, OmpR family, response regulator BaeR
MTQPSQLVLIAEDEPKLAALLASYLLRENFRTQIVNDGRKVIRTVKEVQPDLLLLDLTLPHRNGLEICRELRSFTRLPILIVTARAEEADRLLGLDSGADDYICKPFSPREVIARVKAVLRRTNYAGTTSVGLVIDEINSTVSVDGKMLDLTLAEFNLLRALAATPNRLLSRQQIMDALYSDGRTIVDRTIDSHIKNLRRKLAEAKPDAEWIESVYGAGYRFKV